MHNPQNLSGDALTQYIVDHPKEYGFEWFTDNVRKGTLGPWAVPLVRHVNATLLIENFGEQFFATKTSRHVTNQRITRDLMALHPTTKENALKFAIVQNMQGIRAPKRSVMVETRFAVAGVSFATMAEAQEYGRKVLSEKEYPAELIEDILNDLIREVKTQA